MFFLYEFTLLFKNIDGVLFCLEETFSEKFYQVLLYFSAQIHLNLIEWGLYSFKLKLGLRNHVQIFFKLFHRRAAHQFYKPIYIFFEGYFFSIIFFICFLPFMLSFFVAIPVMFDGRLKVVLVLAQLTLEANIVVMYFPFFQR